MHHIRGRLLPLWAMVAAYALILGLRWRALPHDLAVHFTASDAPVHFLARGWFAALTFLILCAAAAVVTCLLPRHGECGRGMATLSFGFAHGVTGFTAGVFWSLVRTNAGLGSSVRPAVAAALGFAALGLVLGVSAPAPVPARWQHPPVP
ncbi:MAG: hypothetical protein ACRD0Y_11030 [Terriglobales bacterium]